MGNEHNNDFNTELAANLNQIAASAIEIHRTAESEVKNIEIINHNLNEATLDLKELSEDAEGQAHLGREIFADIDEKLDSVQESAVQSMCQSQKAAKQKPMFASIEKMIHAVMESLEEINDDIMEPMHTLAVNGAIQANRPYSSAEQLSSVLKKVSEMIKELTDQSKSKLSKLVNELKPYIETAQKLSVTNDEFFLAAQNAATQMGKAYDCVQEIKIGADGMAGMLEGLRDKAQHVSVNLSTIENHVCEFAGSVKQTTEAIGEIEKSIEDVSDELSKPNNGGVA